MKAIILAGGAGKRLRPLTEELPKPLVPFHGEPLLFRIIRQLQGVGIREIMLTLGYRADQIKEAVTKVDFGADCRILLSQEESPLGTAGGVLHCKDFVTEDTLIISGDCVIETDFTAFINDFESCNAAVSILAKAVADPQEFGTILTDERRYVRAFLEKPVWEQVRTDLVSTGIYLIKPEILAVISDLKQPNCDFAKDVFPVMLTKNMPIRVYETDSFWCDVGSPESYRTACLALHTEEDGAAVLENNCEISEESIVRSSVLWKGCQVGQGAVVRGSILCDGVQVGAGAIIQNAVVGSNTVIEEGACVVHAKVDAKMTVAAGTSVTGTVRRKPDDQDVLRFPSGSAELVGSFTYSFLSRLSSAVAMFFEEATSVAVISDSDACSEGIAAAVKAGLLACGRVVKEGKKIACPVARWILRNGICDGGVFITGSRILLLNGHGNDLNRAERRRFKAIFTQAEEPAPVRRFYKSEELQNPEDYYITELMKRFRCSYRSLDYLGRAYTKEDRAAMIARVVIDFYPEAPIFISQHGSLCAEEIARNHDRYTVRCGEKPGDMMEEMEKLMHIPGVYEQYLMLTDDLALDLAAGMLLERNVPNPSESKVFSYECDLPCGNTHRAAALRKMASFSSEPDDLNEDGLVIRDRGGKVHVRADGEREAIRLYVESFNEEFSAELMTKWQEAVREAVK